MEKFICNISHERDIPGGGFKFFTAGEAYGRDDIPGEPEPGYFEIIRPAAKKKTEEVK